MSTNDRVSKISVIGVGMRSQSGVAQKMFQTLGSKKINILAISTSEIKISVLIEKNTQKKQLNLCMKCINLIESVIDLI